MTTVNTEIFKRDLASILEQAVKFSEPVTVTTNDGNAVIISEDDYNSIQETLFLSSIPCMRDEIIEGLNTPIKDCIPESEIEW